MKDDKRYIYQVVLHQVRHMIADVAQQFDVTPDYVRAEIRSACNLTESQEGTT